jgi:hypothetical protein
MGRCRWDVDFAARKVAYYGSNGEEHLETYPAVADECEETLHPISWEKYFVPILYRAPAFDAFDDFSDFVESISCETSKSCQVRGSNPCRGPAPCCCQKRSW